MASELIQASERHPVRVIVAGGGVAALEAVLALRALAPGRFEVELLAPEAEFHNKPLSVAEPFGAVDARPVALRDFAIEQSARFVRAALAAVEPAHRRIKTSTGDSLGYDALLIALGASARPTLPGALTFRGPRDVPAYRTLLGEIDAGDIRTLAFAVPRRARWSLPLYELALMTAVRAAAHRTPLRLELVTHEPEPLAAFGPKTAERARQLLSAAGIRLRTSVEAIVAQPGRLFLADGTAVDADRTVAASRLVVPPIHGIPQGPGGFIPTDPQGRVDGLRYVYAAGDATWFPLKQGGIATQQADAAVSALAADCGLPVEPETFEPVLRGIFLTGDAPEYLGPGPRWHASGKIAGRYLAPYLAEQEPDTSPAGDHAAALELALAAADAAAYWDDPKDALRWLGVAQELNVALPMEYADKRREWTRRMKEATR